MARSFNELRKNMTPKARKQVAAKVERMMERMAGRMGDTKLMIGWG